MPESGIRIFAHTIQGLARQNNEDAFSIEAGCVVSSANPGSGSAAYSGSDAMLYAVADGMGGHPSGEVASRMALERLQESLARDRENFELHSAITDAHNAICASGYKHREHFGMGTTVVGVLLLEQQAQVFNVGDSPAYLLNASGVRQVSIDDSAGGWITQCLGAETGRAPEPHIAKLQPQSGDLLLLVSDGISGALSEAQLAKATDGAGAKVASQLCLAAQDAGSGDDTTAVVVAF